MKRKIAIIGAGGLGRELLDIAQECNDEVLGFIVHAKYGAPGTMVDGVPILGGFDWLVKHARQVEVICGVGAPHDRLRLIDEARQVGARFCTLRHPSALLGRSVQVGEGSALMHGCILTTSICVGAHVVINPGCTLGHDTMLSDFVTLSPGVHLAGNVTVGEGCNLGIGTIAIEKKTIGAWAITGAGTVIIKDVPPNVTVVGVPARVIKERAAGWHMG